jgi:hypothetical protein
VLNNELRGKIEKGKNLPWIPRPGERRPESLQLKLTR